jgi:hypothetical protein
MHSLLAGRMLLRLREVGARSVSGDGFLDLNSTFTMQFNALAHKPAPGNIDRIDLEPAALLEILSYGSDSDSV